jgi:hypothetical protein
VVLLQRQREFVPTVISSTSDFTPRPANALLLLLLQRAVLRLPLPQRILHHATDLSGPPDLGTHPAWHVRRQLARDRMEGRNLLPQDE